MISGYRGRVQLSSQYQGCMPWFQWGSGVDTVPSYTFTAADAGTHTLTPAFGCAGDFTATITDMAKTTRTGTSGTITITNAAAGTYTQPRLGGHAHAF